MNEYIRKIVGEVGLSKSIKYLLLIPNLESDKYFKSY